MLNIIDPLSFWSVNLVYFNDLFYNASIQRDAAGNPVTERNDRIGDGKAEGFSQMASLPKL